MKKTAKRLLSLVLVLCMVLGVAPLTAWAAPSDETTAPAEAAEATTEAATDKAVAEATETIDLSVIKTVNLLKTDGVEIDEEDPTIITVEAELKNMKVLNAEGDPVPLTEEQIQNVLGMYQQYQDNWKANANLLGVQTPFFLSYNDNGEDGLGILGEMLVLAGLDVATVRAGYVSYDDLTGMIQNFLYGDALGVQLYGEAIAAARDAALKTVEESGATTEAQKLLVLNDWLAHNATFDMTYIMNADKEEGEKPMIAEEPVEHRYHDTVYDVIYADYEDALDEQFRQQIRDGLEANFKVQYYTGAIESVVHDLYYAQYMEENAPAEDDTTGDEATDDELEAAATAYADEQTEAYMTANADAINADPVGFVDSQEIFQQEVPVTDENGDYVLGEDGNPVMMTIAAQLHAGWEQFWEDAQTEGVEVDPENAPGVYMTVDEIVDQQMDTPMDDLPEKEDGTHMTPNEAIPGYAAQAAEGLTQGVLNYWEGSHIGVLGEGTGVCLGYTKAYAYLVQYMHPEVYGVNGAETDLSVAENWKAAADLYYDADGNLDITKDYVVDAVRISFDAEVTMFGEKEDSFQSDHFWNAVQINGQWYYIDPCYTDVYGEVMMRDRVETDGYMNHLYFLFSHDTTVSLYEGNYSEIKSLYSEVATDKSYEDSWISRVKSNVYSDGSYFYYLYDSTDLISMMEQMNVDNSEAETMNGGEYKLVRHAITSSDDADVGDTDYDTLIEFNYTADEESDETVARVKNSSGEMVENELLTTLYAEHEAYMESYPSLAITAALYDGKLYFNLSNCILTYDLSSCEVTLVKEYNTVYGQRDKTNAFGGMGFSVVSSASDADFTVENHPLAGLTIKADGNLYVSVATNFGFISGKDSVDDQTSYGYEFEETNYNAGYSNYGGDEYADMMESMGYSQEDNDNDEFMWSANFVETLSMSHLTGTHTYESVSVAASCEDNAFTENRCTTCGAIEADTRVETADTAHGHHYIRFDEKYYTGESGFCYVCTHCYDAVSEPTEPQENSMYEDYGTSYEEQMERYEEELAEYEAIAAEAGHTYIPTDAEWNAEDSTVTFQNMECGDDCFERQPYVDCLLADDTLEVTLTEAVTADTALVDYEGDCADGGAIAVYQASGKAEGYKFTATQKIQLEEGSHAFEKTFTWTAKEEGGYTATVTAVCAICGDTHENVEATVEKSADSYAATCTTEGQDVYTATAVITNENGETLATLTETKTDVLEKASHDLKDGVCTVCGAGGVYRIYGEGRCETAIEVAEAMKENLGVSEFDAIIIANGDNFADALAGSYLSAKKGAPILLYRASAVEMNLEYIQENLSSKGVVYLLGGTVAVPEDVETGLKNAGIDTKRLAGDTRFDTNLKILEEAGISADQEILVCTGFAFADSLSASATGLPILLVNNTTGELTENQISFLESLNGNSLCVIGGTSAVSTDLIKALGEYGDTTRIGGETRYETSVLVAERYFDAPDAAVLAYARNFPDGLCGGALAYSLNAPLILTDDLTAKDGTQNSVVAAEYAAENEIMQGAVLGGTGLISDETAEEIFSLTDEMGVIVK